MTFDIEISEEDGGYMIRYGELRAFATDAQLDRISSGNDDAIRTTLRAVFEMSETQPAFWAQGDLASLQSQAQSLLAPTLDELQMEQK